MLRLIMLTFVALLLLQCEKRPESAAGTTREQETTSIAPSNVRMANNRYMTEPQVPVVVEDKTYCCPMCEQCLRGGDAMRSANDPVSGQRVDKALAVIGAAYAAKRAQGARS